MRRKPLFDIIKTFKPAVIVAFLLMGTGIAGLILLPFGVTLFNLDIDFTGGTTMHVALNREVGRAEQEAVASVVAGVTGTQPSSVQAAGDGRTEVIIKTETLDSDTREAVFAALAAEYGLSDADKLMVDNVSPIVGADLRNAAILATTIAVVLILLYITVRFNFRSGLAAVIALTHDLLVMLSFYIILQIPMNMNFIASILTILGYSLNATIIVFDRVRENMRLMDKRSDFDETVNRSVWQTMARTINTSFTTLLVIIMIIALGVESIRNFAVPLLIGVLAGVFSSVFLSGPLWAGLRRLIPERR